jgi:hypothetical protein
MVKIIKHMLVDSLGQDAHTATLTRMLGIVLRTEQVLSTTPGVIGDEIRPLHANISVTNVASNILSLAYRKNDAAVALLLDAAVRWFAGNRFKLDDLRQLLRRKLVAASRHLRDLIEEKLK